MAKSVFLLLCVLCFFGCKNDDPLPENFMSASISGKVWIANVANSQQTNVAATIAQNLVAIVGVQESGGNNTVMGIIFPENITVGQEVELNPANKIVLAYAISDTEGYLVDPTLGGSGKLTVTQLDRTNNVVEALFSGQAVHTKNGSKIQITNGRFRSKLYSGSVKTTSPGKK